MRMHSTLTGEMCSIVSNPQPMSNPLLQDNIMLPGEAAATTAGKGLEFRTMDDGCQGTRSS